MISSPARDGPVSQAMAAPRCARGRRGLFSCRNRPAWERRGPTRPGMNHSSSPAPTPGRPTPASRGGLILAALRVIDIREDWDRTILAFFVRPVRFDGLAPARFHLRTLLGHALRASFFSRTENAAASRGCIAVQPSATATRTIRCFYRDHQTPMRQTHVWPGPLVTKHLASYCADESGGPKTGRRARAC